MMLWAAVWVLAAAAAAATIYALLHAPAAYARAVVRLESAARKADECAAMQNGHTAAERAFCAEVHHTLSHSHPLMVMVDDVFEAAAALAHRAAVALAQAYVLASAGHIAGALRGITGG